MIGHLSALQIEEWLIGQRPAEVAAHLARCSACAAALDRAAQPLTLFGNTVRDWSAQLPARPIVIAGHRRRTPAFGWRGAMACAAVLVILAVPAYRHRAPAPQPAPRAAAITDEILLQQVASGISRSVPAPMEPLAQLLSGDSSRQ
jgi:hypothetical protein